MTIYLNEQKRLVEKYSALNFELPFMLISNVHFSVKQSNFSLNIGWPKSYDFWDKPKCPIVGDIPAIIPSNKRNCLLVKYHKITINPSVSRVFPSKHPINPQFLGSIGSFQPGPLHLQKNQPGVKTHNDTSKYVYNLVILIEANFLKVSRIIVHIFI
jgi:hypothetical protein